MPYTCPVCNMTSHNPNDEEHGYCGNCNDFTCECGGGEPCWRNPETGYVEYCPRHEGMIADFAMEKDKRRMS